MVSGICLGSGNVSSQRREDDCNRVQSDRDKSGGEEKGAEGATETP